MIYGYYITDTAGSKRFFAEGCYHCRMSTGGQHEPNCPYKEKVASEEWRFSYPDYVRQRKAEVDAHPE